MAPPGEALRNVKKTNIEIGGKPYGHGAGHFQNMATLLEDERKNHNVVGAGHGRKYLENSAGITTGWADAGVQEKSRRHFVTRGDGGYSQA